MVFKKGILLVILVLFSSLAIADSPPIISDIRLSQDDCIYFFYGEGCEGCSEAEEYIDDLAKKNPTLEVEKYEVYQNVENHRLLEEYFSSYQIREENQGIPVVFLPKSYFVGVRSIKGLLAGRIEENSDNNCPSLEDVEVIGIVGDRSPENVLETLTFFLVTRSAYRDSYKAGPLALLLVLLVMLVAMKNDEDMLKKGFIFTIGAYLGYLVYGMGWISWVGPSKVGYAFYKLIGIFAVIIGFLNIRGFFGTWRVWKGMIPPYLKEYGRIIWKWSVSPGGAFLVGLIAGILTLPNFSTTFLSLRALLGSAETVWIVWPLLLYYGFLMVFHLLVVVLLLFFSRFRLHELAKVRSKGNEAKMEIWHNHANKLVAFFISFVMLIIGLVILFI